MRIVNINKCKVFGGIIGLVPIFLWLFYYYRLNFLIFSVIYGGNLFLNSLLFNIILFEKKIVRSSVAKVLYVLYFGFLIFASIMDWGGNPFSIIGAILLSIPGLNVLVSFAGWVGYVYNATRITLEPPFFLPPLTLLSLSPFYMIPLTIYFSETIGNWLQKFEMLTIEDQIKELESVVKDHDSLLERRNQLEKEINKIIEFDPANFSVKSNIFRGEARQLNDDDIRKRINTIDEETQKTIRLKMHVEKELDELESGKEALRNRLEEIKQRLHTLEIVDPANVKIKLQKLCSEWEGLSQKELENIKTTGELEHSYKEQLLLKFQIEDIDGKIKEINEELTSAKLAENALIMEKLILELEKLDRDIKKEEPRLFQINDELKKLEMKRDKLKSR